MSCDHFEVRMPAARNLPRRQLHQSGITLQAWSARAQRGAKAQPGGRCANDGAMPESAPAACRAGRGLAPSRSAARVRCSGWASTASTGPCSTMRPAYITAMRSARPAMTARSCVTQISAVPVSGELLHLGQDLRLDGDVERGGRLIGDQQSRAVQQRNRDRHALAHAAGKLVRVRIQPLVGRCYADMVSASRARARAARATRSHAP